MFLSKIICRKSCFASLKLLAFVVFAVVCCTGYGETIYEDFTRGPSRHGWITIGDRSSFSWNDKGWMDVKTCRRVSRFMRQVKTKFKKDSKFFFAFDVMVIGGNSDDKFYRGLMTPAGNNFNNFIGSIANNDASSADIVKSKGASPVTAKGKKIGKPYIVRVEGDYKLAGKDGVLTVRVLDLLDKGKEISKSILKFNPDNVKFSRLNIFGIGNKYLKGDDNRFVRYDNLYFSTKEQNKNPLMPSFINSDLVEIRTVSLFSEGKKVKVKVEIDSIIDSEKLEVKGALIPDKKLSGDEIWEGTLGRIKLKKSAQNVLEYTISGIKPELWTPYNPKLYNLTVGIYRDNKPLSIKVVRFGFKKFETKDGKFFLNGKPIFLRGCSLNPPAKNVLKKLGQKKSFIRDYIRDLKLRNVNIIRMHSEDYKDLKNWLEICDELGMMVFQGCYGIPPGATASKPSNDISKTLEQYKNKFFKHYLNHPSVVIYTLSNEVAKRRADQEVYFEWLKRICKKLKSWNPNSVFLADAGITQCNAGDIEDHHFYAGWYYGSFLDYINFRKPTQDVVEPPRPVTLSECVGAFTTRKNGFPVMYRQTAAALCWGGNRYGDSKFAQRYQAFLTRQSIEQFRRFREHNERLSGIMPYSLLYKKWVGVRVFSEMGPKPAADQMRVSFQPILVSIENWTPHKYAGSEFKTTIHVINDSNDSSDLLRSTIYWELSNYFGKRFASGKVVIPPLKYYGSKSFKITIPLGKKLEAGGYRFTANLKVGSKLISSNGISIFIGNKSWVGKNQKHNNSVRLYDPSKEYMDAFEKIGIKFAEVKSFSGLRKGNVLVIGGGVDVSRVEENETDLRKFVSDGGVIVVLDPGKNVLNSLGIQSLTLMNIKKTAGVFINRARKDKQLFSLLPDTAFFYWSDPEDWNESKPGFPNIAPAVKGMRLKNPSNLKKAALLANFGRGLQDLALIQIGRGNGSVIVSGFDFLSKAGIDPIADRFLYNILTYAASKKKKVSYPIADRRIKWGNYKSENGIVSAPDYGLLLNGVKGSRVTPVGNEYYAKGRRIAGPYRFNSYNEVYFIGGDKSKGQAVFYITTPRGAKYMTSSIKNPGKTKADIMVRVNNLPPKMAKIQSGKTVKIRNILPSDTDQIQVFLKGDNQLILLNTRFN